MASPPPQAGNSPDRRTPGKPPFANSQAASGEKDLRGTDAGSPAPAPSETAPAPGHREPPHREPIQRDPAQRDPAQREPAQPPREKDWGLEKKKSGMARETKIGFLLVLMLLGAFGYVVYRKLNECPEGLDEQIAQTEEHSLRSEEREERRLERAEEVAAEGNSDPFGDQSEPAAEREFAERPSSHEQRRRPIEIPDLDDATERVQEAREEFQEAREELREAREVAEEAPPRELQEVRAGDEEMAQLTEEAAEARGADGAELVATLEEEADSVDDPPRQRAHERLEGTGGTHHEREQDRREELAAERNVEREAEREDAEGRRLGGFEVASEASGQVTLEAPEMNEPAEEMAREEDRLGDFVAEEVTTNRAISRTKITRPAVQVPTELPEFREREARRERGEERRHGIDLAAAGETLPEALTEDEGMTPIQRRHPGETTVIKKREHALPHAIPTHEERVAEAYPETVGRGHRESEERASPAERPQHAHEPRHEMYTVQPNDNFWSISKRQYGTARLFMALTRYNQNRVADPAQLRPGMEVATPPREVLERNYPELIDKNSADRRHRGEIDTVERSEEKAPAGFFIGPEGHPLYRVGPTDTLTGISQRHLGRSSRWVEIYDRNRNLLKRPDALQIGTVIRLPPDASRLSVVPDGVERR